MTKIWDLPTRAFHWLLAAAVIGLVVTGKIGGDDVVVWHARLGYCVGALLLFRIVWGFAGGHWSRFSRIGNAMSHGPLGALSVFAMLLFLTLQVASGLFTQTKEDFAGPLTAIVSDAVAHFATGYHKRIGQVIVITLVSLHVAALAFYAWRGRRLVAAMWHGRKTADANTPASRDDARMRVLALVVLSLCSLVVVGIVQLGN